MSPRLSLNWAAYVTIPQIHEPLQTVVSWNVRTNGAGYETLAKVLKYHTWPASQSRLGY